MKLIKLKLQGFKSFTDEQVLWFSSLQTPGFFFLTGQNLIEPKLGANGVGKSSIYDAISWVLFGKTVSGLKAGSVGNWSSDKICKVELEFDIGQHQHTIIRTWKPNSLKLDDIEVEQNKIDELIGLSYESFTYTVLVGQFTIKFFDLSPADKLQLFTEVLDLDRWLKYSEKAKKHTNEFDATIRTQEQSISYLNGQIETLSRQDYTEKIEEWNDNKVGRVEKLDTKLKELRGKKQYLSNQLVEIEKEAPLANTEQIEQLEQKVSDIKSNLRSNRNADREIQIQLSSIGTTLKHLNEEWTKLKNLEKAGMCPMCLQKVTGQSMSTHFEELKDKITKVEETRTQLMTQSREAQSKEGALEVVLKNTEETLVEIKKKNSELSKKIEDNKREQKWVIQEMTQTKELIQKTTQEENPYTKLQEQNKIDLINLKDDLNTKENQLLSLRQKQEMYKYWEKGFKEIRLMVVEEVLKEFEIQTNNNLQRLGLADWKVEYSVDQETKSGTVRKGFTVMIQSPVNNEMVPFECWSGGEGQRLRLAGTLGLMDLISNRTPNKWSIELWDEPTQHLSLNGIDDLVQVLRERAHREDKQVLLADHRDFITRGEFTGVINVVKDEKGSKICIG